MSEAERIRRAYHERDSAPASRTGGFASSGYQFWLAELEWALLRELRHARVQVAGARVFEAGCGSGFFLDRFLAFGAAEAVGVDLVAHRIQEGRQRYPLLHLEVADAAQLPYAEGSFDIVTQFTCLSSILDPALRRRVCAELWRVTRPGGAVVSYDIRRLPRALRTLARIARVRAPPPGPATPTAPVALAELRSAFPGAVLRHRTVTLELGLGEIAARGRPLAWALSVLPWLRTHLLVVAIKPVRDAGPRPDRDR